TRDFAADRGLKLIEIDIPAEYGFDIETAAATVRRPPCGACGLSKRHLFNQAALDGGYDVVATGHNLDDEAAVLFGNVLRWDAEYLGRQYPVLPASPGFVRKVKPLVRLTEREMAAYCVIRNIDYIVEECPMAAGNRHLAYKEALNTLEQHSPGAKANFLFSFLERGHERFAADADTERAELTPCTVCGSPTTGEVCAFCRMSERIKGPER
ncbi:MAG TPA: tRNA(Ile)-lysidine synthetase, partial [Acidimicrobiia bacterium]|nr:tRNA(Ile)-lysidine synthetase [Acidimicrobiia bacterium]